MKKHLSRHRSTVLRASLALAGATGLLSLFGVMDNVWVGQQHCEPLRRA